MMIAATTAALVGYMQGAAVPNTRILQSRVNPVSMVDASKLEYVGPPPCNTSALTLVPPLC